LRHTVVLAPLLQRQFSDALNINSRRRHGS